MMVSASLTRLYPCLSAQIWKTIAAVPAKPRIWAAVLRYAEMNGTAARQALLACSAAPAIDFKEMPDANGAFAGAADADRVYLAKSICERCENTPGERTDARMLILLDSTLLHELVHWGDWKDGRDQAGDEGKAFERAAYGRDVSRYW